MLCKRHGPVLDSEERPEPLALTGPGERPVVDATESFCIRDGKGQALAYIYFEGTTGRRMAMSWLTNVADRGQHRQAAGAAAETE